MTSPRSGAPGAQLGREADEARPIPGRYRQAGVVVCRGCCCGNQRRDPVTDHAGQLVRLHDLARARPAELTVRTSECLGPCAHANVVVVRPSPDGRRLGGRPVWFAFIAGTRVLSLLEDWLADGGPGLAAVPDELDLHVIPAPRPTRPNPAR
ncbi:MAG TPA: (2Fe-2S) ferredoxin domain-containing protein [Pseudonocardia sp.]|nr:(2Fe-2S) ferredoxin domain-containing protein [Pseudonocardia sp.]